MITTNIKDTLNIINRANKELETLQDTIKNNCGIDDLKKDYFENMVKILCNNFIKKNNIKSFNLSFFTLQIQICDCDNDINFETIKNDLKQFRIFLDETINDFKNNN